MQEISATPYSNLKIFAHTDVVKKLQEGKRVSPIYIRIKPTNKCNHRCYYCSYADSELGLRDIVKKSDEIPLDKMKEIINDMKEMGVKAVTFSGGGDPLVYSHIIPAMKQILNNGIDLSIITNGQLLKGEIADILSRAKWVRISFDAAREETYEKVRNLKKGSFSEVCDNIKKFSLVKENNCELGINFVIHHENYEQIYEAARLVKELGVNHIKFAARITKDLHEYHKGFKDEAIKQIHCAIRDFASDKFRIINKYETDFTSAMVFHRNVSACYIKEIFTVIGADSNLYFCHDKAYVKDGIIGSLQDKSLKEVWFSAETTELFKKFNPMQSCNHHCVYDDRNNLLNSFLSLDQNHINFI